MSSGDLKLLVSAPANANVSIIGAGAATTIVDAGLASRVIRVNSGRSARLSGLTLRNGKTVTAAYGEGGGLSNWGTTTVDQCVFDSNSALGVTANPAGFGGAIFNNGKLYVSLTTFTANSSTGKGGAVYNSGTALISDSSLNGNSAAGDGAGIFNDFGGLTDVKRSTLYSNIASVNGGAIANAGTLYVGNGTITTNIAHGQGGGVSNTSTSNIYNSTIVFNKAETSSGIFGGAGGGAVNTATFNIRNTVIAYNTRTGGDTDECKGAAGLYGNNDFGNIDSLNCVLTQNGPGNYTVLASPADFGPLTNNGGPTKTYAIATLSAMVDGADPTLGCVDQYANPLITDQRGKPRIYGERCDIGAFEYTNILFADGFDHGTVKGLVINEVDYDQPGTDNTEFIEIYNSSAQAIDLAGVAVVLVNGASTLEYLRVDLGSASTLAAGSYLVVHSSNLLLPPSALSIVFPGLSDQVQNGPPDGIALIQTSPPTLLDALSYEGSITLAQINGFPFAVSLVRGTALNASVQDSDVNVGSLARLPNGSDTNNSYTDWAFTPTPTPGTANH